MENEGTVTDRSRDMRPLTRAIESLNRPQRYIVLGTVIMVGILALFPPWLSYYHKSHIPFATAGHHWIGWGAYDQDHRIDFGRLGLEYVGLISFSFIGFITLYDGWPQWLRRREWHPRPIVPEARMVREVVATVAPVSAEGAGLRQDASRAHWRMALMKIVLMILIYSVLIMVCLDLFERDVTSPTMTTPSRGQTRLAPDQQVAEVAFDAAQARQFMAELAAELAAESVDARPFE